MIKIIRILLGIIFLYAGIDKILHPFGFAISIYNYRIVPDGLISPLAVILPWVECLLGIFLVLGIFVEGSALLSTMLLGIFSAIMIFNLIRGVDVDCGCFSQSSETLKGNMAWYIIRDLMLFTISIYLMRWSFKKEISDERSKR